MQPLPLQSASARTPRMEVLDVIRGVTMILVVFHHVRGTTFGLYNSPSPLSEFLMSFRMPMFFFISGFVAYKAVDAWSWSFYGRRLWKKAMVELLPTAVFFGLFVGLTEWDWDFPGGYWFTVALFGMLAVYYTVSVVSRHLFPRYRMVLLMVVALAGYVSMLAFGIKDMPYLPSGRMLNYFPFFVTGVVCRRFSTRFLAAVIDRWVVTLLILSGGTLVCLVHFKMAGSGIVASIVSSLGSAAVMFSVFSAFYSRREYWKSGGRLSRALQFVGRRTLDVYMIHWFLLPRIPQMRGLFYNTGNNILELAVIGGVALVVVGGCLLISGLIRTSPLLGHYLFGAASVKKNKGIDMGGVEIVNGTGRVASGRSAVRRLLHLQKNMN